MTIEPGAYKEPFLREARASLEEMTASLLEAEASSESAELTMDIFRGTHTIKGMAAMMRYEGMASLCHAIEDVLDRVGGGKLDLASCADALLRAFDLLAQALQAIEDDKPQPETSELEGDLRAFAAAGPEPKTAVAARAGRAVAARPHTLPVKIERLDLLMNLAEEMIVAKMRFDHLRAALPNPELSVAVDTLDRLVSELQYQVTQTRMTPIGLIFGRFARLVRDLAKQQHKEVAFVQEGGDIEVDRFIADEISESLVHLLRNAVDHGIEPPDQRARRAKKAEGTIRVAALRIKNAAVIEVEDDGAGLDLVAIRRAAEKRGLLAPDAAPEEVLEALYSGVSTADRPTAISGRGLGLDIVNRRIRSLGGALSVASSPGKGASFRMEVPLTLAIIKTLFVGVGGRAYAVPLTSIETIIAVNARSVKPFLGGEAVVVASREVPLLRLRDLFQASGREPEQFPVVVVARDGQRMGLAVDALATTQEIVLKPINQALREIGHYSGAAITGDGEPVLVLDVQALLERQTGARA